MKKIILIVMAIIVAGSIGGYFSIGDNSIFKERCQSQTLIDKCGDNICDEFEKNNPDACAQDCGSEIGIQRKDDFKITTTFMETCYPSLFEKTYDNILGSSGLDFPVILGLALIISIVISLLLITKTKSELIKLLAFIIPIFIEGGALVLVAHGDDFGLAWFFGFIIVCFSLFINYMILAFQILCKKNLSPKKRLLFPIVISLVVILITITTLRIIGSLN